MGWDIFGGFAGDAIDFGKDLLTGPEMPAAPDYTGAAEATAAGNLAMAQQAIEANRANQITPWGSSTWAAPTEEGGRWTQTTTLSPEQQALFSQQQATDLLMGQTAQKGLEGVQDLFGSRFQTGYDPIGTYGDKRQGIMDAMLSRVSTDVGRDRESKASQLIAAGIPQGSEAFNREMERFDRQLTDARQQAEIAATQQTSQMLSDDIAMRRQGIAEMLAERQTPLNELAAFRSGTQVGMPQFSGFAQMPTVAGPDYLSATGMQSQYDLAGYNADVARQNAMLGGLFRLGGAAVMASDRRLKHNIVPRGIYNKLPVYEFSYIGSDDRHVGVMAQDVLEVNPDAVITMSNGYYAVDYRKL